MFVNYNSRDTVETRKLLLLRLQRLMEMGLKRDVNPDPEIKAVVPFIKGPSYKAIIQGRKGRLEQQTLISKLHTVVQKIKYDELLAHFKWKQKGRN